MRTFLNSVEDLATPCWYTKHLCSSWRFFATVWLKLGFLFFFSLLCIQEEPSLACKQGCRLSAIAQLKAGYSTSENFTAVCVSGKLVVRYISHAFSLARSYSSLNWEEKTSVLNMHCKLSVQGWNTDFYFPTSFVFDSTEDLFRKNSGDSFKSVFVAWIHIVAEAAAFICLGINPFMGIRWKVL